MLEEIKDKEDKNKQEFNEFFQKKIYRFTLDLIKFLENLKYDPVVKVIRDQLLRSGTSIGANQMEAQSASSKKDFVNFYHYSLKSANESKFWLSLLKDTRKAKPDRINKLMSELDEISKILGKSIISIKGKK